MRRPEVYAARKLRRSMTLPEAMVWRELRGQKHGFKVRWQHPIGPYVIDFYVAPARLVVEVDGEAHDRGNRPQRDKLRDDYLRGNGYRLLRIPAVEVLNNLEWVLEAIIAAVQSPLHPRASLGGLPPRAGEEF